MAQPSPPWVDLPPDITAAIFRKVGHFEMLTTAQLVCKKWHSVCLDPSLWLSIHIGDPSEIWRPDLDREKLYRNAVDRSQGQLIELKIEKFDENDIYDLLSYVSRRCSQLKRLHLIRSFITSYCLKKNVKNFHQLEELHLYYGGIDGGVPIETIGRSCPFLKSFTCREHWNDSYDANPHVCDVEARAIAVNMPGLRHLRLNGSKMTNGGLQTILERCPHLESLDLRQCIDVVLDGEVGRVCREMIRDLKCPDDPTDDYPVSHYDSDCVG